MVVRYDYRCKRCEAIFERVFPEVPKSPGARRKCIVPDCGGFGERYYGNAKMSFRVAGTVAKQGKEDVEMFYREAIEDSKERLANPTPYARYDMTHEAAQARGGKRLSDTEVSEKVERARKMTIQSHEHAGLDPSKPLSRSPRS